MLFKPVKGSYLLFRRERNTLPELGLKEWMAPARASPGP
jgi:hypothetical protein